MTCSGTDDGVPCGKKLRSDNKSGMCEKHAARVRARRWYLDNPEKVAAHREDKRRKNQVDPEKNRAYQRAYQAANREARYQKSRAYIKARPAQEAAYGKRWRSKNKEKVAATAAAWKEANPDRARAQYRKAAAVRRARERGAFVESVSPLVVLDRDAEICHICGWMVDPDDWHMDHVIPLALGGEHSYANVAVSHPRCNMVKGAKILG